MIYHPRIICKCQISDVMDYKSKTNGPHLHQEITTAAFNHGGNNIAMKGYVAWKSAEDIIIMNHKGFQFHQ